MKMSLTFLTAAFCLHLILATGSTGLAATKRIDKQFRVRKDGILNLYSDKGSVSVSSHASLSVEIVAILTANGSDRDETLDNFSITLEEQGGDVEIRGKWTNRLHRWHNRLRIHYDVLVPDDYNLKIETSGGSIKVGDLHGRVDLKTSGGPISVGEISGPANLNTSGGTISLIRCGHDATFETSGGSIRIGDVNGSVVARTSGGSIRLRTARGDVEAFTSGGGLKLRGVSGNLRGRTSGGSISAELLSQIDQDMELETSGGSIDLIVPDGFSADLDASTSGGRVRTDLPLTVTGSFSISKRSLRGEINGGGERVRLRTSGGNIEIRRR